MASSLSSLPPTKTSSPPTTTIITHFPSNPKTLILQQCKTLKDLTQIHSHLIKTQLIQNPETAENLLEAAAIILPLSMSYAASIFDNIEKPLSPFFNIMIRGYTSKQNPEKGVIFFKKMCQESVFPDGFTFPCVLKACAKIRGLREGEQIHGLVIKNGFSSNGFVQNSLIYMYASCGCIEVSRRVFDGMGERDVVTWNAIFSGYAKSGEWGEVVGLFNEMVNIGIGFDQVTLVCVLTACGRLGDLKLGEWIYNHVEENGLEKNLALVTSLVDMYAKCGRIEKARELFDRMGKRDVVAWSAMISGYNQARRCKEALELFNDMQMAKVEPNEVTMASVFSSCAVLGALETGKWAHSYVKKRKMRLTVTLGTSLIDLYAKCGCVETAIEVFHKMPMRNVLSWTVLIQCLASNGQGQKAIEFFNLMLEKKIKPNDVTFLGVLCACTHAGLVDEGRQFFVIMSRDFGIEPRIEHFNCMVDILGRAGLIEEAYQFVKNMPLKPNAVIWRTLLASCKVHKNVELGEESFKNVVRLESTHSGDYILLSNIYASVGRWDDAVKVRNEMKIKGIKKSPGCCEIVLDGVVYEFLAEDNANPLSKEVYNALDDILKKIKIAGYVPNTTEARLDAEEDDKEVSVSHHSEKLAIAFGLIRTSPGTTIRISKNLRVCTDCHNATKMISKVFDREIVVRDRSRFHHFKNGSCSCNDYW